MKPCIFNLKIAALLCASITNGYAQDQKPANIDNQTEGLVGTVYQDPVRVAALFNHESNGSHGAFHDMVFDGTTGNVLLIVATPTGSDQKMAYPVEHVEWKEGPKIVQELSDEQKKRAVTFAANERLSLPIVETYLMENFKKQGHLESEKLPNSESYILRLSQVIGMEVVDEEEERVGKIDDIVIDRATWNVAYVLVKLNEGEKQMPVPIGAFETTFSDNAWQIELISQLIEKFPTIGYSDSLPQKVDRGWVEYVAVRYGRDAVQNPAAVKDR